MGRLSSVALLTVTLAGCASTGAVPRPFPLPGGYPPPPGGPGPATASPPSPDVPTVPRRPLGPAGSADGYSISSTALSLRGSPYKNGGTDPTGFDCSGLVQFVFAQHGVRVPRDVRQQFGRGKDVDPSALEPGDLVFFTTVAPGASHVGIIVGGDQFVHAPSDNGVVRVEHLGAQYWADRFVGAKRID